MIVTLICHNLVISLNHRQLVVRLQNCFDPFVFTDVQDRCSDLINLKSLLQGLLELLNQVLAFGCLCVQVESELKDGLRYRLRVIIDC